jgi:hypothetical protein
LARKRNKPEDRAGPHLLEGSGGNVVDNVFETNLCLQNLLRLLFLLVLRRNVDFQIADVYINVDITN